MCLVAQLCLTLKNPMNCSPPASSHGNSPGKNTGEGCCALLQGVFLTQGSNPGLPHWRWFLYYLSHQGSPRILECVAYPFSRGTSQPRNQSGVSCIAGEFFTSWATWEAHDWLLITPRGCRCAFCSSVYMFVGLLKKWPVSLGLFWKQKLEYLAILHSHPLMETISWSQTWCLFYWNGQLFCRSPISVIP